MQLTDTIQKGLKRNIFPFINDADFTSLGADVKDGDVIIKVPDNTKFLNYKRVLLEDTYNYQENWVERIFNDGTTVQLITPVVFNFSASDTTVVIPHRFIFNSWPSSIDYGKIHKGELLKASKISWFAEEEEMQSFMNRDGQMY